MYSEMTARIEELCKDEEYVKYVLSLGSAEAMSNELQSKDVYLSPDEIHQIGSLLKKKANGELNDEELEQISGGFDLFILGCIIAAAGTVVGVAAKAIRESC